MIAAGSRVRVKNDPSKVGLTTGEEKLLGGRLYLGVEIGGKVVFQPASGLEEILQEADALRDLASRRLSAPADLARTLTHIRLNGRLADMIYSMEATNTDFHAYQFKPVVKLLNSAARGLLVADEVGLGKTIEAGLIWTELVARYNAHRLLVVCPKSLQEKWRLELRNRFNVTAQIVDATGLLRIVGEAQSAGSDYALIASLSGVRAPKGWNDPSEAKTGPRVELARYLDAQAQADPLFDLVIFDEAHHLRNPETAQHQSAAQLVFAADYKLMLSATPINLRSEDLRSLLRLLEPDIFDREWIFDELQDENAPIVAARERALDRRCTMGNIREAIAAIGSGRLLKTDRRLKILKEQLEADAITDTPARRADIAARLEEMSLLGGLLNRTRRRDVAEIQIKRRAQCRTWAMNDPERSFYERVSAAIRNYALDNGLNDGFFLSNAQRLLASSLPAAHKHWTRFELEEAEDEEDENDRPEIGPLVAVLNAACRGFENPEALAREDSKFDMLLQALEQTWGQSASEKVILFSAFRGTIDYLQQRLSAVGIPCEKLHAAIKDERTTVLSRFAAATDRCVLLASEIGSEGLDLQFCRLLINYDLPWNPMRVEQRIGRIDRIGQKSASVDIINLICEATIEERIYKRLYDRLQIIERSLGGFEPILGDIIARLQDRLLDPSLTAQEINDEIDRAAQSAENRKKQEEQLEEEAPGLIAHGDMILDRIRRTHDNQGWINADELYNYVRDTLGALFPQSALDRAPVEDPIYDLKLCPTAQDAFRRYVETEARRYPTRLRRQAACRVRFGRKGEAGPEREAEVIHAGHPFVRFIGQAQERSGAASSARPAVWGWIASSSLPPTIGAGRFGIVVQHWSTRGATPQDRLIYAGLNLATGEPIDPADAEAIAVRSSRELKQVEPTNEDATAAATWLQQRVVNQILREQSAAFLATEEANHTDKKDTLLSVLQRQRDSHREKAEARIGDYERAGGSKLRMVPAEQGKLAKFMARMDHKIASVEHGSNFEFEEPVTLGVLIVEASA